MADITLISAFEARSISMQRDKSVANLKNIDSLIRSRCRSGYYDLETTISDDMEPHMNFIIKELAENGYGLSRVHKEFTITWK